LQPNNTNNLIVDFEVQDHSLLFERVSYSKFSSQKKDHEKQIDSYKIIEDPKAFYEKNLRRFLDALEEVLKKEFKEFFEKQGPNELLNQDLLGLIIGSKVVYCYLGIKAKGTTGAGKNAQTNKDQMFVVLRGANGGGQDDLKILCLLAESGTDSPIKVTV
jgi:hypothetical protein